MDSLITQAQGLNQADYTEESWNQLQVALKAAVELKDNVNATQSDIDAATTALQEAIEGLVKVGVNMNTAAMDSLISPSTGIESGRLYRRKLESTSSSLESGSGVKR